MAELAPVSRSGHGAKGEDADAGGSKTFPQFVALGRRITEEDEKQQSIYERPAAG